MWSSTHKVRECGVCVCRDGPQWPRCWASYDGWCQCCTIEPLAFWVCPTRVAACETAAISRRFQIGLSERPVLLATCLHSRRWALGMTPRANTSIPKQTRKTRVGAQIRSACLWTLAFEVRFRGQDRLGPWSIKSQSHRPQSRLLVRLTLPGTPVIHPWARRELGIRSGRHTQHVSDK